MPHIRPSTPHGRPRSATILLTATATLALVGGGLAQAAPVPAEPDPAGTSTPLADMVNPFIGTQDEGNTYPGAAMPFGMVQFSPDNGHNVGYDHTRESIRGFSLVHLSGVGCSLGGALPMLPTTGDVTSTDNSTYALKYSHDHEDASAGQYSVDLQAPAGTITAELTATPRTAVARYTFPETDKATVLINTGQALNTVVSSSVTVVDRRTVDARVTTKGFCQDTPEVTFHTRTVFDRDVEAAGTWSGDTVTSQSSTQGGGRRGAWVQFDTTDGDRTVEAQTSLSYVDAAGATANLLAEASTHDQALALAKSAWEQRLESIRIESGDATQSRIFYSSLYRSFLAPNIGSDVDGRYTGWDQKIHTEDDPDFTYYQNFSLWDTYRTQEQLVALLDPATAADQALSLVRQGQQSGWLPRWGFATVETNIMTGDPGTAWLVSAWSQGLLAGHEEETYQLLLANADGVPPTDSFANGRAGNVEYIRDGYVPQDPSTRKGPGDYDLDHGGSATLEYALSDAALSTMARALGHTEDADRLAARGTSYRNIFDPATGNFRARDRSGAFYGSSDPAQARGFHEAAASQYTWLVQQNPYDLMDLLGGREETVSRLDHFFAFPEVASDPSGTARSRWVTGTYDYYGFDTYNPNNEPDLHAPYMYLWAGQPWKTSDVIRAARTLFTDGPTGVTGNDDLGTMSAWYVLASIGLYPSVPGQDLWSISTPAFDKVTISRPDAKPLVLEAPGLSDSARYIQGVEMDGQAWDKGYVEDATLDDVSRVEFEVGETASTWATGEGAAPAPMIGANSVQQRLSVSAVPKNLWTSPGDTLTVEATVIAQGAGTVTGTLDAAIDGLSVDPGQVGWSIDSDGLNGQHTAELVITAPQWATSGRHVLTLRARSGDLEAMTDIPIEVGPASYLEEYFTETAIGDIGSANADFDGMGYFHDRTLLAGAGMTPGALEEIPGTDLRYWIQGRQGAKDNLRMRGQTITVPQALAASTQISLVGASNNGSFSGQVRLGLRDAVSGEVSSIDRSVTMPDWCSGTNPQGGARPLAIPAQRGTRTGSEPAQCGLYSTVVLDVPEGSQLVSLTLPDSEKMHLFAIASDAPVWQTTAVEATPAQATVGAGAVVPLSVRVTPAGAPGTVRVYEGDQLLAEATRGGSEDGNDGSSGVTEFSIKGLGAGTHELNAVFVPSDPISYSASSAESVTVEVEAPVTPTDPTDPGTPTDPTDPGVPTDPTGPPVPVDLDSQPGAGAHDGGSVVAGQEGLARTGFAGSALAVMALTAGLGTLLTAGARASRRVCSTHGRRGR